jgi:hypothetical protein
MFNFLKKTDQKNRAEIIAKEAKIETVYDQGKISGFIIFLQKDGKKFISKMKDTTTLSTFVDVIEERIKNDDYEDSAAKVLDYDLLKDSRKDNVSKVTRVVSEANYTPIFHWTPPT